MVIKSLICEITRLSYTERNAIFKKLSMLVNAIMFPDGFVRTAMENVKGCPMVDNEQTILLEFSGSLTLRQAECVRSSLLNALADGNAVEVDCAGATEVDISFPQLLISARRMAAVLGKTFVLSAPAAGALRDTLLRGGFLSQVSGGMTPERIFWTKGNPGQS